MVEQVQHVAGELTISGREQANALGQISKAINQLQNLTEDGSRNSAAVAENSGNCASKQSVWRSRPMSYL